MSYNEWRRRMAVSWGTPVASWTNIRFWEIIDYVWTPEEQNALVREWKDGTVT